MNSSRWFKCDLQVSTPAWNFEIPSVWGLDKNNPDHRAQICEKFVLEYKNKGVDAIALTAHNSHEWIDEIKLAGKNHDLTVFPGCEITTGSGTSGVHLLIIGDPSKTSRDIDELLMSVVGFGPGNPRFQRGNHPAPSPKSFQDILNDLPSEYLAIAPHALNDDGVLSDSRGHLREKMMSCDRLMALDVGDYFNINNPSSYNGQVRKRTAELPRIKEVAFVSTSDAYSIENIASRFCWIRMGSPTIESLRQACLDHEARILDHLDPRLKNYADENPNKVKHNWIEKISIDGSLLNPGGPIEINFHHGLNVVIGSRGSGKSTIVTALRSLYSGTDSLPKDLKAETDAFIEKIFGKAIVKANHLLAFSQDRHEIVRTRGVVEKKSNMPVRVISQKELFSRVAPEASDINYSSRSFLSFLDEGLALLKQEQPIPGSWWAEFITLRSNFISSMDELQRTKSDVAQLESIESKIKDLEGKINAIDSKEMREARARLNSLREVGKNLLAPFNEYLKRIEAVELTLKPDISEIPEMESVGHDVLVSETRKNHEQVTTFRKDLADLLTSQKEKTEEFLSLIRESSLVVEGQTLSEKISTNTEELKKQGILDPNSLRLLQDDLETQHKLKNDLLEKKKSIEGKVTLVNSLWNDIEKSVEIKRKIRSDLLAQVMKRSKRLRFKIEEFKDIGSWVSSFRELLGLKGEVFAEDIPKLGEWIASGTSLAERLGRFKILRNALIYNDYEPLQSHIEIRVAFLNRLKNTDQSVRLRLSTELIEDVISIEFLKDNANEDDPMSWQDITQGSPGQRTAAMLGFVLHHGDEPLILDQPEDDLDAELISQLVVKELRSSRWGRQVIVITHNANIPVIGDAEKIIVMENRQNSIGVKESTVQGRGLVHAGPIENTNVRKDVQNLLEGGVVAFLKRERKYSTECVEEKRRS